MAVTPVILLPPAPTLRSPAASSAAVDRDGFSSLLAGPQDDARPDAQNAGGASENGASDAPKSPSAPRRRTPSPPGAARSAAAIAEHRRPSPPAHAAPAKRPDGAADEQEHGPAKAAAPAAATDPSPAEDESDVATADETPVAAKPDTDEESQDPTLATAAVAPPAASDTAPVAGETDSTALAATADAIAAVPPTAPVAAAAASTPVSDAAPGAPVSIPAPSDPAAGVPAATATLEGTVPALTAGAPLATPPAAAAGDSVATADSAAAASFADILPQETGVTVETASADATLPNLLSSDTQAAAQAQAAAPATPAASQAPIQFAASAEPGASASPLPSALPLPSAAPNGSIAPALRAAASLGLAGSDDQEIILVQSLPRGTAASAEPAQSRIDDLQQKLAAHNAPMSFGSAALPGIGIPALAAALFGGNDQLQGELAGNLPHTAEELSAEIDHEAAVTAGDAAAPSEHATGEAHANGLSVPLFTPAATHAAAGTPIAAAQAARAGTPLPHLPGLQILPSLAKAALEGGGRFNIQLHPQDLGRVRVELDIGHDGQVTASITAAHPETLELLRRDASALQQALNDAGLKTDGNALSFNLQGDGQDMAGRSGRTPRASTPVPSVDDPLGDETGPAPASAISLGSGLVAVDIRI